MDLIRKFNATLERSKTFQQLWHPDQESNRHFLMSLYSQLLATSAFAGPFLDQTRSGRGRELRDVAIAITVLRYQTGQLPEGLREKFLAEVERVADRPNLGLWTEWKKGSQPHDFAALAAWLKRDNPVYFREYLRSKKLAPSKGWRHRPDADPSHPYLENERDALEWLGMIDSLSPDENRRLQFLKLPQVGQRHVLGRFAYTVEEVFESTWAGSGMARVRPREGAAFVAVKYVLENLGGATATVQSNDAVLVDHQQRQFSVPSDTATALAMSGEKNLLLAEVQPGLKTKLKSIFEVPANVIKDDFFIAFPEKGLGGSKSLVIAVPALSR